MAASEGGDPARGTPWGDVVISSVAAVSWAVAGMAGTAALGLHLLGADAHGSLGPMTAAVTVLAVGGSVTPSGAVSAFGLEGAQASAAVDFTPLGVGLVGALLLSYVFLRSLRAAGARLPGTELAARAGMSAALLVAVVGGLAWVGHDVITFDGGALRLGELPGADDQVEVPGLGGIGDIGDVGGIGDIGGIEGLLPDRLGDLVEAEASVGFTVNTADSLVGALVWVLGVLLVALLAGRRVPLPPAWEVVRRVVRPAVSALVAVVLLAVGAGLGAAAYAAAGDEQPGRIAGAALLGAPNGVWLGVPLGLFVPWEGKTTGESAQVLPDPLDELLRMPADAPVTVGRLAELDGRMWLLAVACALMMLSAGVLAAVRTPRQEGVGAAGFAVRCGVPLGVATAVALPVLVVLTEVSADASLAVLGVDAFGAGLELHGDVGMAALLGAAWGAAAGAVGALLVYGTGAGTRGGAPARVAPGAGEPPAAPVAPPVGPYRPSVPYRPPNADTNPYLRLPPGEPPPPGVPPEPR
ncbi:streptophobe family protein [Streptomyces sp. NPDC007861]|uniref:streptophobe family protein n=1 Tax=Streptomyces sp. NPDC007861 TaxID=3154893 RepID=UPI0033DF6E6D